MRHRVLSPRRRHSLSASPTEEKMDVEGAKWSAIHTISQGGKKDDVRRMYFVDAFNRSTNLSRNAQTLIREYVDECGNMFLPRVGYTHNVEALHGYLQPVVQSVRGEGGFDSTTMMKYSHSTFSKAYRKWILEVPPPAPEPRPEPTPEPRPEPTPLPEPAPAPPTSLDELIKRINNLEVTVKDQAEKIKQIEEKKKKGD